MDGAPNLNTPMEQKLYRVPDDVRAELLRAINAWIRAPQANKNLMIRAARDLQSPYSTTFGANQTPEESPAAAPVQQPNQSMKFAHIQNGIAAFKSLMQEALNKSTTKNTKETLTHLLSAYESVLESLLKE